MNSWKRVSFLLLLLILASCIKKADKKTVQDKISGKSWKTVEILHESGDSMLRESVSDSFAHTIGFSDSSITQYSPLGDTASYKPLKWVSGDSLYIGDSTSGFFGVASVSHVESVNIKTDSVYSGEAIRIIMTDTTLVLNNKDAWECVLVPVLSN